MNKEDIYNKEITLAQFNMDDIEETINITGIQTPVSS